MRSRRRRHRRSLKFTLSQHRRRASRALSNCCRGPRRGPSFRYVDRARCAPSIKVVRAASYLLAIPFEAWTRGPYNFCLQKRRAGGSRAWAAVYLGDRGARPGPSLRRAPRPTEASTGPSGRLCVMIASTACGSTRDATPTPSTRQSNFKDADSETVMTFIEPPALEDRPVDRIQALQQNPGAPDGSSQPRRVADVHGDARFEE